MKFGIAFEGVTDYITLENILCGYFKNLDSDDIKDLQPQLDETDKKQLDFGGWGELVKYLKSTYFRDNLLNTEFIIIQIDTDISQDFGVSHYDKNNQELAPEQLVENIKNRLISFINTEESSFYEYYADKIIFAICVHSLECWIYAFYNKKSLSKPKITGCGKALNHLLNVQGFDGIKDKKLYIEYSKIFLKRKNIDAVAQKDTSFNFFIQQLSNIPFQQLPT
jgi:hypothetical protein